MSVNAYNTSVHPYTRRVSAYNSNATVITPPPAGRRRLWSIRIEDQKHARYSISIVLSDVLGSFVRVRNNTKLRLDFK